MICLGRINIIKIFLVQKYNHFKSRFFLSHLIEYQLQADFFHRFAKRHAATGFSLHLQEFIMDLPILFFISNKISN